MKSEAEEIIELVYNLQLNTVALSNQIDYLKEKLDLSMSERIK